MQKLQSNPLHDYSEVSPIDSNGSDTWESVNRIAALNKHLHKCLQSSDDFPAVYYVDRVSTKLSI